MGEAASADLVMRWVRHPDDRVFLALLEHAPNALRTKAYEPAIHRFHKTAERDGPVWGPLRDRIDRVAIQDKEQFLKLAAPWFRQASAEEVFQALQPYSSDTPYWVAAKEVRAWSPQLVTLITTRSPRSVGRLGRNRFLTDPKCVETLLTHLFLAAQAGDRRGMPWGYEEGTVQLFRRLEEVDEALVARSLNVIKTAPRRTAAAFARALGSLSGFNDDLGRRILAASGTQGDVVAAMIEGKRCSIKIARLALRHTPRLAVRRAIAKRTEFLTDPEIRADLATSDCARVKRALISTATPEEAGPMVERLAETNVHRALEVMEEVMPECTPISVDTMARLLQSEQSTMRERAMRILSDVHLQADNVVAPDRKRPIC